MSSRTNMDSSAPHVLIIGCGYLGSVVAAQLVASGAKVTAVTRSAARATRFRQCGWEALVGDLGAAEEIRLPMADALVFAMGHDRGNGRTADHLWARVWRRLWSTWRGKPPRTVAISTTGVYGLLPRGVHDDHGWLTESSPCAPQRSGAIAHWRTEQLIQEGPWGAHTRVLRVGGLYGADRLPRADDIRAGRPIAANPDHLLNLIHVEDAARVVGEALRDEAWERLTVVTDGHPVRRAEFYGELATLLAAPPPRFEWASDQEGSQRGGYRRIRSERFASRIQPLLRFPSYQEGLTAIFGACR